MPALITADQFRRDARAKRATGGAVIRVTSDGATAVAGKERTLRWCFSDGSVDRMGDTIDPNGWDLTDFTRNPVALWAHDSSEPPIGRASDVGPEGQRLMGDIEFAPPETYPFADTIYRLALGKFVNAVSVGFMPIEWEWSKDDDREWGIDFQKQSLLEISVCPVPANPNALAEARAKGIDTRPLIGWAERLLDGGGKIIISRSELERLRKAAKEPAMTQRTSRPRFRADGAGEDDNAGSGMAIGNCGRKPEESCGMTDPEECSVHRSETGTDEEEKRLLRLLRRLLGRRRDAADGDPIGDEPLIAHEDAIRLAHKCLRTSKSFMTEAMSHHAKALDLLQGVVDALDEDADDDDGGADDPGTAPDGDDPDGEARRLRRAQARQRRLGKI